MTDHDIYVEDFVLADTDDAPEPVPGRVVEIEDRENSRAISVEEFSCVGPTGKVTVVPEEDVELHPDGRKSVIDTINDSDDNNSDEV